MAKISKTTTPAQCMANIIRAGMAAKDINQSMLADMVNAHRNTVAEDLRDPERIPQNRLWLYMTALDIPVDAIMRNVADGLCNELIRR